MNDRVQEDSAKATSGRTSSGARAIRIVSNLITFGTLLFIGRSIWVQKDAILSLNMAQVSALILAGGVVYFASNLILLKAWGLLLIWLGGTGQDFRTLLA